MDKNAALGLVEGLIIRANGLEQSQFIDPKFGDDLKADLLNALNKLKAQISN